MLLVNDARMEHNINVPPVMQDSISKGNRAFQPISVVLERTQMPRQKVVIPAITHATNVMDRRIQIAHRALALLILT